MKVQPGYIFLVFAIFMIQGCGSIADTAKIAETKKLIENREFEIEHDWLIPIGGSRINLIGNPNFIKIKKDSVNLFLPFFGERFSGGGYNSEGGILYNGPLRNLEIESGRKNTQVIKYTTKQDSEILEFSISIFPEGNVVTRVNSSQRSFISYQGRIKELKEQDE